MEKNAAEDEDRKISVIVEFVAGKKTDSIVRPFVARLVLRR
jgi:hypothetical protein